MQLIQGIKRIRRRPLVTVCWLDHEVSMVRWAADGKGYRCCRVARLGEGNCDASGYLDALQELVPGYKPGRVRVRWILLREAWPGTPQGEPGKTPVTLALPGWVRRCWEQLDPAHLDVEVVSAVDQLESALQDLALLREPGSGLLMRTGGRFLLVGRGSDGAFFRRISRRDLVTRASAGALYREWLLQTRSLFRNRTGLDLKTVHIAEETGINLDLEADFPVDLQPAGRIEFGGVDECVFPASACRILHSASIDSGLRGSRDLELSALAQRQRWYRWERRLRLSTGALIGCWCLMFLGACRHEAILPEVSITHAREWALHREALKHKKENWQRVWSERKAAAQPFALIAQVIDGRPEGVSLDKIRFGAGSSRKSNEVSVHLEGTYSGQATHPAFRQWLEDIRHSNPITRVQNLQFARADPGIAFVLEGDVQTPIASDR